MRADRAAAGLSGAAILVVIAVTPGGLAEMEVVLLVVAGLVVLATFAPALPLLHRLPVFGAPHVRVIPTFEAFGDHPVSFERSILRLGFINDGHHRVRDTLINVVVSSDVIIEACDPRGKPTDRGSLGPDTELDGQPASFWIDKDVGLPVGATLLHYRLTLVGALLQTLREVLVNS